MLDSREKIFWERKEEGLILSTPSEAPDETAVVYNIQTLGKAVNLYYGDLD